MTKPEVRAQIRAEVEAIQPFDGKEEETKEAVLRWIDSGVELCRHIKPATPPQHLVSYFIPIDGDYLLLADHIRSGLWLPPGGHVEPGEDPRETVVREAFEELSLHANFFHNAPLFLTNTWTVGPAADRHRDVHFGISSRPIGIRRSVLIRANFMASVGFTRETYRLKSVIPS